MLRVTTLHAASAAATAKYYATYLTAAPGEVPGTWSGRQAATLGLAGHVDADQLEALLSGRDPVTGMLLGRELVDRLTANGEVVKAVSGFDATFSAPKSLSVWWALTGDTGLLDAHDIAVAAALRHLERFGSTTRIRSNGGRLHPDTGGLTMATFRQTTSRADDPQIHTHAVISAKVQTSDGRWLALDARYLKRHQRTLGGLYQSVLRNELTHRYGVAWALIVNGQAEIAGVPTELKDVFSKRTADVDHAVDRKVEDFKVREGRDPSRWERAAITREAAADTRSHKSGQAVTDLRTRWTSEAAGAGWTADQLIENIRIAALEAGEAPGSLTVEEIVNQLSANQSSWTRPDVLRAICDVHTPVSQMSGRRWHDVLEDAVDRVVEHCVDLDPTTSTNRRASDGRSVWIEPTANQYTSEAVLTQEEHILAWAIAAQDPQPVPSDTVNRDGLDTLQADAAAAVAGHDRLTLVVGPAGAGKTRMLATAVDDLTRQTRTVFGVAPTAKAARVLERDTGMRSDTVAKLLYEWQRNDRPPDEAFRLPSGTTLVVDEAGMLATPALQQLITLTEQHDWRLVLVGDHRQLQAVGRGGMFAELCTNGRVDELEQLHRFSHAWEAVASLQLRQGNPRALDAYEAHGRIIAGTLATHLDSMAQTWIEHHRHGDTIALVASSNQHVDTINAAVQAARLANGELRPEQRAQIAGGEHAHVGETVATRRNSRRLLTTAGEPVRNRETWTVDAVDEAGGITVTRSDGHGTVTLPTDYVRDHVRLGYAATEHGYQSDTVTTSIALTSPATTRRGLYVAATRGRDTNQIRVITDISDAAAARDILEMILASDRADQPATTQRRTLAATQPPGPRPVLTPRCRIPDWFHTRLNQARDQLDDTVRRHNELGAERERLQGELAAAERHLVDATNATAPDRHAVSTAASLAAQARQFHTKAQRQLDNAPLLARRAARRGLADAREQLDDAEQHLTRVQHQTGPSIRRYNETLNRRDASVHALHAHDLIRQLDKPRDPVLAARHRVRALEIWQRWAEGEPVPDVHLRGAVRVLNTSPNDRRLADAISRSVDTNQIKQRPAAAGRLEMYAHRTSGQDVGIER